MLPVDDRQSLMMQLVVLPESQAERRMPCVWGRLRSTNGESRLGCGPSCAGSVSCQHAKCSDDILENRTTAQVMRDPRFVGQTNRMLSRHVAFIWGKARTPLLSRSLSSADSASISNSFACSRNPCTIHACQSCWSFCQATAVGFVMTIQGGCRPSALHRR